MVARREQFSGNILLYNYLSAKRAPVFLTRSLSRALEVHRHQLENGSTAKFDGDNHALRAVWKPPSDKDLNDIMARVQQPSGSFVLEVHDIKSISKRNGPNQFKSNPARKSRVLLREQCTIQVSVFLPSANHPSISVPAQGATLRSAAKDINRTVSVETDRIIIKPDDFKNHVGVVQTIKAYKMYISINFDLPVDAELLYTHLAEDPGVIPEPSTRLTTTWANILECPPGKVVLPLRDRKDSLDFGLEVTMYWASSQIVSSLVAHNTRLRATEQLGTPLSPSPPRESAIHQPSIKLTFVYANETVTRKGLACPHEGCHRRRAKDIEDFRMHLDSWHDYFKYRATPKGLDAEGNETWVFECDISDHKSEQRASARATEPFDIRTVAPRQPFNQTRYLNEGNDEYQRMSKLEKRHMAHRAPATLLGGKSMPPRWRTPAQVRDMPPREKRRYPVPAAPAGITFVRSSSRRPLSTGEDISESDDEVDEEWIKLRKSAEFIKDKLLPDNVKCFLKGLDQHLWAEQLHSDLHVGDAVIRFARVSGEWIRQEEVFKAFKNKVDELLEDQEISQEVYAACLKIAQTQKSSAHGGKETMEMSQRLSQLEFRPRIHEQNRTRVTDPGTLTPVTADSDGDVNMQEFTLSSHACVRADDYDGSGWVPPYDLCLCGQDAQVARAQIGCTGMDCIRRHFHYDCIKERWKINLSLRALRMSSWVCADCNLASPRN
ncbi:hypothetical protein CC86DRAFT_323881 [Ophiobolus disseminans]|uniref:Polycomb protein VEFS-Box domain-containing protein n=1 Tax=Ophiobolus disseminans TaxID=1469910 RepID=A0A6A7A0W9_9PLEO|nr:hypothetical protein CC86DRAFT_323881 [Ophiobolus disseminans]